MWSLRYSQSRVRAAVDHACLSSNQQQRHRRRVLSVRINSSAAVSHVRPVCHVLQNSHNYTTILSNKKPVALTLR